MGLRTFFLVVVGLSVAGCTQKVADYCDETTPCQDPARPYCDLTGATAESEGITNTCVANPFDASVSEPDAGVPDAQEDPPDAAPLPAELAITPDQQDFGSVVEGQTSAMATFTISNSGETVSGTLSVSITGAGSDQFSFAGTCDGATLDPGDTCAVEVTFGPDGAATNSATLEVSATPGGTVTAGLAGVGLALGDLSMTPTSHSYGSVDIAATSGAQTFTIENTGGSATGTLAVSLSNTTDYALGTDNCNGNTLTASQTCTVSVTFGPGAVGSKVGSLLVSASPGGNVSASLGGTGTADVTVTKTGTGASGGTVTSNPAGINCGGTCTASFSNTTVTLSATTDGNTSFAGWSGSGCSGTGNCPLTMTTARSVTANFLAHQCTPNTTVCSSDQVTVCDGLGQIQSTTPCPLGCHSTEARCLDIDPSNDVASYLDLASGEADVVLPSGSSINTTTGYVSNGSSQVNVTNVLLAAPTNGVDMRVLIVKSIVLGTVGVTGTAGLVIVSDGDITINGALNVGGFRNYNGPGAYDVGSCRGADRVLVSTTLLAGGGGGGFGGVGGKGGNVSGGNSGAAGVASGNGSLVPLRGGCRGGGYQNVVFGGAGGAVQLVSRTKIAFGGSGSIDASGGGGTYQGGAFDPGAGCTPVGATGGGSGGGILLEAPVVEVVSGSGIHANGGGGGCGFQNAEDGQLSTSPTPGATCSGTNGSGGAGAARLATTPGNGTSRNSGGCQSGGGGGGGIGRIRINTGSGAFLPGGGSIISPAPSTGTVGTR